MNMVSSIYNSLFDIEARNKSKAYPIHKRLNLKDEQADLLDLILSNVMFKSSDHVLDAGCGTGYSLVRLAQEKGVSGKGISISKREVDFAKSVVKKEGLERQISFEEKSFDHNITDSFDKIIAIESLKHSSDLTASIKNLTGSLSESGTIIIADDFITAGSDLLEEQKKLWKSPGFTSIATLENVLDSHGDFDIHTNDLSRLVRTRNAFLLRFLIQTTRIVRLFLINKFRIYANIYLGSLLLEYFYIKRAVSYHIIIATKKSINGKYQKVKKETYNG